MENISYAEELTSFSDRETGMPFSAGGEDLFIARKKRNQTFLAAAMPVNNYLKTPEEIEAEFLCSLHTRKVSTDSADISKKIMDGYTDIHDLNEAFSGFMEENY